MQKRIFVFGSNLSGIHGAGAALTALLKHGAITGLGVGHQGNSYAIPTKDKDILRLTIEKVESYVDDFLQFAKENPHLEFQVTAIGTGLAGFKHSEIAPLFKDAPKNCFFDKVWKEFLPKSFRYWGTF